jgi:hypothetical protein
VFYFERSRKTSRITESIYGFTCLTIRPGNRFKTRSTLLQNVLWGTLKGSALASTLLVLLLVLAALPNPLAIVSGSLVASWSISEGSATLTDSVGGYSGVVHGAKWSPAAVVINSSGYALDVGSGVVGGVEFKDKSYVEVPDAPIFRSENFSVAFWVSADTSSDYANVMGKQYYVAGQQAGWMICWGEENPRLMHLVVFNPSHKATFSVGVLVTLGEWTHLVFTLDSQTIAAYKNGKLVGKVMSNGYLPTNEPFRIGRAYGEDHYFDGLVDDILLYNSAISETDVRDLYSSYALIAQGDTNIEITRASMIQGQESLIEARLRDQAGRVLVGVRVSFYLDNPTRYIGTATTDSRGYANIFYELQDPGTYSLRAEFGGIDQYHGSSQTAQITVANVLLQQVLIATIGVAVVLAVVIVVRKRRYGSVREFPSLEQV